MNTILNFLSELKENNNKEWFDANRSRYQECRKKMLFVTELLNIEIQKFDLEVPLLDPKDCLFRIFRDVRFSNNKTPYKINMGSFIAKDGRKSIYPGYYLHLEPGACFIGGGIYMPGSDVLKAIRTEIEYTGDELKNILNEKNFKSFFSSLYDNQLKTAPKGYPKDHVHIDLLKYKSYSVGTPIDDLMVSDPNFISHAISIFKQIHLLNKYLYASIHNWM